MSRSRIPNDVWSTGDEIRFLLSIEPKETSKLEFLKNYKEAALNRVDWGDIKKEEVLKVVNQEIYQLQKGE